MEPYIPYVVDRYYTLGINNTIRRYNISSSIFTDMKFIPLANKYPDIDKITLLTYGDLVKGKKELHNTFSYNVNIHTGQTQIGDTLAWCGFTHDYAISYCIYKGAKNVVLLGAGDFTGLTHHVQRDVFNYSNTLKEQSKYFIENVCSKYINIFTCNNNSYMNVPRANIQDLLE